ncbi:aldo/keto reductase [Tyzzerella sp. OttesenSCG-928-J15]|nr:aldo/keto reductase [Tyzzerella sp. OttesenSCG-928-J15]
MQYRKYGKTGFEVSLLGLGCMRLPRIVDGTDSAPVDREKAYELIRYAAEHGINYFDTAFTYHSRTSEEVLGEALDGGLRKKVHVATKQPLSVMTTQADIRKNLELTLKKLRTDYLDVYIVHNIQDGIWGEIHQRKIYDEFMKFKEEGLVKAVGFSFHGTYKVFNEILTTYDWDMCQVQQNMIDQEFEATEQAIFDAGEKGCGLVIMEPLRGGGLANATAKVKEVYSTYEEDRKPVEWAFRHLINYPQVSTILSGMTTLEQLKDNIEIFSKADALPGCLSAKEKDILAQAKAAYKSVVTIPCTGCEYCLPCPNGVNIPGTFSKYNEGMMFENFDQPKRSYMFIDKAGKGGDKCIECGACESQCPQHIDIINQLKIAHDKLKGWVE